MIGTLFLWMYWPSFNGALSEGITQHRVVCNTTLAIAGSCVASFITGHIFHNKFDMDIVMNATLAGGVGIGTSSDMIAHPSIALAVGIGAGVLSSWGIVKVGPFISDKFGLHDTCGVHSLHGMPGVYGALVGVIAAAVMEKALGRDVLESQFAETAEPTLRTAGHQAAFQLAALCCTLLISILTGAFTGWICSWKCFNPPSNLFLDREAWH